jgi:hypothetical protein
MAKYKIWEHDYRTFQFTLKEGGAYVDITNKDCYFTCKTAITDTASIFDVEGTVTVASEGTFQAVLSSAETAVCCRNAICQVTTIDGDDNRTVYGEFFIDILPKVKN